MSTETRKPASRIYRIIDGDGDRLIRAASAAQAIRHAASHMQARVATQDDIAELVAEGAKVETAGEQQQPANPPSQDEE